MIIKFKNWVNFQYRKGSTPPEKTQWFKFENSILYQPIWSELDGESFKCFVFMMCVASLNKNSGVFQYNDRVHIRMSGIDKKVFDRTIKKLKQLHIIEIRTERGMYADGHFDCSREDKIRIEEKREEETEIEVFDFESLYKKYPRKVNRSLAESRFKQTIKTAEDYKDINSAVSKYSEYCVTNNTEERYILHMSTFIENRESKPYTQTWRDWINQETGTALKEKSIEERIMRAISNDNN